MSSLNKAQIIGYLGRDPETRYMPNGDAVTNFSVATTEKWKDKASGDAKERTEWHRITMFGKLAEIADQYLQKGARVYVEGKLTTREWEDKDGIKRYTTEIRADNLVMLGDGNGSQREGGQSRQRPSQQRSAPPQNNDDSYGDDIPF